MKLGIMQPYFFPYIGYWQLINAVDKYVIADEDNYIKAGWMHRNRILNNGDIQYFGLKISKASSYRLINEVEIFSDAKHFKKMIRTLECQYQRAPYFDAVFPLIHSLITNEEKNLAKYLERQIRSISSYLSIETEILVASDLDYKRGYKGQDEVIEMCQALGAKVYINAIGGQELYSHDAFAEHGIELKFLQTEEIRYQQFRYPFTPNLSIIDILMFNSKEAVQKMLEQYQFV